MKMTKEKSLVNCNKLEQPSLVNKFSEFNYSNLHSQSFTNLINANSRKVKLRKKAFLNENFGSDFKPKRKWLWLKNLHSYVEQKPKFDLQKPYDYQFDLSFISTDAKFDNHKSVYEQLAFRNSAPYCYKGYNLLLKLKRWWVTSASLLVLACLTILFFILHYKVLNQPFIMLIFACVFLVLFVLVGIFFSFVHWQVNHYFRGRNPDFNLHRYHTKEEIDKLKKRKN